MDPQSRDYWTQLGAQADAPIIAELEALQSELSPDTFKRVLGLAGKVDTASQRWALQTDDELWERALQHFGPLAKAIRMMRLHVEEAPPSDGEHGEGGRPDARPQISEMVRDHNYTADLRTGILTLAAQLPAEQADALHRVINGVDDEAYDRGRHHIEAETAVILKHFPGIKPAWDVVSAHLERAHYPDCIDRATVTLHHERCSWLPALE
jgi:hypothetical protein